MKTGEYFPITQEGEKKIRIEAAVADDLNEFQLIGYKIVNYLSSVDYGTVLLEVEK